MDEIAVKEVYSEAELDALRAQIVEYKEMNGFSWQTLRARMGLSSTLDLFATGRYGGDNQKIADKVAKFFRADESQRELDEDAAVRPDFQLTTTAKQVQNIARWSQRGNMSVVVGAPGVGKTEALENYALITPNVWMATFSPTSRSVHGMLIRVLRGMGADRRGGTRVDLSQHVRDRVGGRRGLIIGDEAQHLDAQSLEELRAIFDDTGVGLLLSGNREVLTRVEGIARGAAFAQLYSRVSMRHVFDRPREADVVMMLEAWRVVDAAERNLLTRIAMKPGGGALRSLNHTLELATMVAGQDRAARGLDHLQEAWAQLSSQQVAA